MGKEWDAFVPQPIFWKECFRVLKPGGHVLSFAGTRTYDWVVIGLRLAGFEIRDQLAWIYGSGFPKSLDVAKSIEGKLVHGSGNTQAFNKLDGQEIDTKIGYSKIQHDQNARPADYTDRHKTKINIQYTTDQAKQWQGWGTALKPALEPIVMARKPLDGTVADNVLKHGVGGINIDGCRVGDEVIETGRNGRIDKSTFQSSETNNNKQEYHSLGRFPANIIHDGSDEVVALFPETGVSSGGRIGNKGSELNMMGTNYEKGNPGFGDSGSASRFFYTAKASQTERNWGLYSFESKTSQHNSGGIGRETSVEKRLNNNGQNAPTTKNIHPTVKPIDLMRYLVRLVTPKGGVCLDPFLGSGTTAVACKAEKFDYIGIELEQEYVDIANARIKAEVVQYDIFDVLNDTI
jgi:site-specific DNA-methyltransferase (adenine-specific)